MQNEANPSITEHFSTLSDPRIQPKTYHKLIDIIVITLCAVISGADNWVEIVRFGRAKEEWFGLSWLYPRAYLPTTRSDEFSRCSTPTNLASALPVGFVALSL